MQLTIVANLSDQSWPRVVALGQFVNLGQSGVAILDDSYSSRLRVQATASF